MGGSRISDWGGPRIDEARDARKNVAIFTLKSWPIGGGHQWRNQVGARGALRPPWMHFGLILGKFVDENALI